MDQQRPDPAELGLDYGDETDLGYGDDDTYYDDEPNSPQQQQGLPPLKRVQIAASVSGSGASSEELGYDATSSYGDDYTGSDYSSYDDDSINSWEEGKIHPAAPGKKPKKKRVAARQQKRVSQARIFVLVLLALTSIGISLIVFYVTRDKEERDYRKHFDVLATRIFEAIESNMHKTFTAMNTISNSITTCVMDDPDKDWPLVTLDNFEALAEEVRNITGAIQIVFAPLVNETMRLSWQSYSVEQQQQDWVHAGQGQGRALGGIFDDIVDDDRGLMQLPPLISSDKTLRYPSPPQQSVQQPQYQRRQQSESEFRGAIPNQIHPPLPREVRLLAENSEPALYAPVWQISPVPSDFKLLVNLDLFQEPSFENLAEVALQTRQAVLSKHLHDSLSTFFLGTPQNTTDSEEETPMSILLQPVWNTYNPLDSDMVAGYLIALIPWAAYVEGSFREVREEEVFTRVESSCQPQYSLNYANGGGDDIQYLGQKREDDQQWLSYDGNMERTMQFPTQPSDLIVESVADTPSERRRLQENQDSKSNVATDCQIQVYLYATDELYSIYITNSPMLYMMGVIITFVVLAIAFLIYDALVERRQYRVMDMAENTGRILSNLFPTQFADKLLDEKKEKEKEAKKERRKKKKEKKKRSKEFNLEQAPDKQLRKFMDTDNKDGDAVKAVDPLGSGEDTGDVDDSPLFLAKSKPIADLFPDTTVLFSDIAGFTAWSSVREPSQVFVLLESIYQSFDFLAKQYGIFKIETIGDCYVAVCGLPEPREDHAVAMCRFSMAAMVKMKNLVNQLEVSLGPDTGDLTMRFGLHSGPVTAGVLRGERARFQLFGDTVNTAARMESTGERDKIQISQETRNKLVEAGKVHWFVKREDLVKAKGKGELQTYWLVSSHGNQRRMSMLGAERRMTMGVGFGGGGRRTSMGCGRRMSMGGPQRVNRDATNQQTPPPLQASGSNMYFRSDSTDADSTPSDPSGQDITPKLTMPTNIPKKQQRLIDWNCELLQQLLRQIVAVRNSSNGVPKRMPLAGVSMRDFPKLGKISIMKLNDTKSADPTPLDEFVEVVDLPEFDAAAYHGSMEARSITLDPAVVTQLRTYVAILASKYRDNDFHNFEHASHVAMSVSKLLTRVKVPDSPSNDDKPDTDDEDSDVSYSDSESDQFEGDARKTMLDHSHGLVSDPLTQFSVVISALIHDVDHRGVPNNVLIQEEPGMAVKYQEKSVAEQNSIDVAWELLMHETFRLLRDTICGTPAELKRLRQLVVQSVLATDLFDPEMSARRKSRWEDAFSGDNSELDGRSNGAGPKRTSFINFRSNDAKYETNRKATLVIEHIIQASDVAHTMQHWHIYEKWNSHLFMETYKAFLKGRCDKDPSENWYQAELSFFDNYVIPLAKKLKDCGIFGGSSDEYLNYAMANRKEWEMKGESLVSSMVEKCKDSA